MRHTDFSETDINSAGDMAASTSSFEIRVDAMLEGPTGPEATVLDVREAREHVVNADLRAVLLYLLARQYLADSEPASSKAPRDRGWCTNAQLMTGIWGRSCSRLNTLHVLLHRLRAELSDAGIDRRFIEKQRGYTRISVVGASIA